MMSPACAGCPTQPPPAPSTAGRVYAPTSVTESSGSPIARLRAQSGRPHLASGRSTVVGLVIPSAELRLDPYGASMTHAVARAATELDQGLMLDLETKSRVSPSNTSCATASSTESSSARSPPVRRGSSNCSSDDLPTVLVGSHPTRTDVDVVDVENLESSAPVVEHLIEQGAGGRHDHRPARPRRRDAAAGRLPARPRAPGLRSTRISSSMATSPALRATAAEILVARKEARRHLRGQRRDGPRCHAGVPAAGLRIPADIAVVGFDGTSVPDEVEPTLTTVRQPFDKMASAAVGELLAQIEGAPPTGHRLLEPDLTIGRIVRCTQLRGRQLQEARSVMVAAVAASDFLTFSVRCDGSSS